MSALLLTTISPWMLTICLVVVILLFFIHVPFLFKKITRIPKRHVFVLILTLLIGGLVRFHFTPNTHRIYFDEDRYLTYAVTFARFNKTVGINLATPEKVIIGDPDQVGRITVPVVNGWVLKLFGLKEENLFIAAKLFSTLQILLIFCATYLLYKSYSGALLSAILFAFVPLNVYWSPSIGLDSYFVFFGLLAFVASCMYAKTPTKTTATFATVSTILLLFVRLESYLFLLVSLVTIYSIRKTTASPFLTRADITYGFIALPFIAVRGLVSASVLGKTWCCGESTPLEAFGSGYFVRNTIPNIIGLFNNPAFPFIISFVAMVMIFTRRDWRTAPLIVWLLCYFVIYSFYFAGLFYTYEFSGSYGRYFLMLIPPLIILASMGLLNIHSWLRKKSTLVRIFAFLVIVGSLYPTFASYTKLVFLSPYDKFVDAGPRNIHVHLEKGILPKTPNNSTIIHALTGVTLLHNRNAVYFASLLYNPVAQNFVLNELKDGREVYMLQTYSCEAYEEKCAKLLSLFDITTLPPDPRYSNLSLARLTLKTSTPQKKKSPVPLDSNRDSR